MCHTLARTSQLQSILGPQKHEVSGRGRDTETKMKETYPFGKPTIGVRRCSSCLNECGNANRFQVSLTTAVGYGQRDHRSLGYDYVGVVSRFGAGAWLAALGARKGLATIGAGWFSRMSSRHRKQSE